MAIFHGTDHLPGFRNAVVTIGTFDGVHHGHRRILQEVVRHAEQVAGESIVITFEPHPRKLLYPEQSLKLITPIEQKLQLIAETGVEHIVVAPFTKAFSALSAKEYIEKFVVHHFHPESIIIGYDHHFGHDRTGNIALLKDMEQVYGYRVYEIPAQLIDEATVSSTKIRNALLEGRVADATQMLDRPYSLRGTVEQGNQLGRTIGYPTANIQPSDFDQLIPAVGIYAVRIRWKEKLYPAMLSIGYRPTVTEDGKLCIEAHLFEFNENLYGETLDIVFVEWLRHEEKYPSLEALKEQLHKDQEQSLRILN